MAVLLAAMFTVHVGKFPVQSPDHPTKSDPAVGETVSVTSPDANNAVQVVPQLIPLGELIIVPSPLPVLMTNNCLSVDVSNTALIVLATSILTVQVGLAGTHNPRSAPLQFTKIEPVLGAAVSVTKESMRMSLLQSEPQLITVEPSVTALPVTVPTPLPDLAMVKVFAGLK